MKNLIYKHERPAQELQDSLKARAQKLNTAYASFKKLNIGSITLSELYSVIADFKKKDSEAYVRERIYESNQTLKSLPLRKEDVLKIIELPEGFNAFSNAVEALVLPFGVPYPSVGFFKLENEKVSLNEEAVSDHIEMNFCFYLDSQSEKEAYDLIFQIKELLEKAQPLFETKLSNTLIGDSNGNVLKESDGEITFQPKSFCYFIKNIKTIHSI